MSKVRDILGPDKESELMQSFVRIGISTEGEEEEKYKSVYTQSKPNLNKQGSEMKSECSDRSQRRAKSTPQELGGVNSKKRKTREYYDEFYTDKDRAAAVSIGSYDIKQSLSIKRRQDRSEALQLPEEVEPGALLTLGLREFKNGNTDIAAQFISKALDLNPDDQNALIARSKCYLLLGEPKKGLQDAETALSHDKNNIRAIYQKAESLYYLGQFEHSLMFFHRGLSLRPELNDFRLGVQKTQEAIERTIGAFPKLSKKCGTGPIDSGRSQRTVSSLDVSRKKRSQSSGPPSSRYRPISVPPASRGKIETRKLLGELCVEKEYLENLLKNPDLKRADTGTDNISTVATNAIDFLNTRQEFFRQQRPCTGARNKKIIISTPLPKWY